MSNKISQLNSILNDVKELCQYEGDFGTLDALIRKIKLLIKHSFGEKSDYLIDLGKIEEVFPKDNPEKNVNLEYFWISGCEKLENLLNTMIQDIELSKGNENEVKIKAKKTVFIVHGTDHESVNELKIFLKEVGIEPIILHEQPSRGLTIIEKLEEYSNVGYAFVLLTPDDFSVKKEDILFSLRKYLRSDNPTLEQITQHLLHISSRDQGIRILSEILPAINNRARQNVILEFGYFIGRIGRRKVCCLYKGNVELPSDMHGICYLPFRNRIFEVKETILKELRAAEIIK